MRETVRQAARATAGLVMSAALAFGTIIFITVLLITATLTLAVVGAGLLPETVLLTRRIAGAKRNLVAQWTGKVIPEAYQPIEGPLRRRLRTAVRGPGTLGDFRWMICHYVYGFLGLLTAPLWLLGLPVDGVRQGLLGRSPLVLPLIGRLADLDAAWSTALLKPSPEALLADPSVLASRTSAGTTGWVATADYRSLTTDGIDALREASARGPEVLRKNTAFGAGATVRTALPAVLDRTGRALLVSRSTLMIVSVQLVLLAGYALLLVARLLDTERAGETDLLKARGASRRRITGLAVLEALLLAVPAAVGAALVSGPLVRLLARWSSLDRSGVRLGDAPVLQVWLVAAGVAVCCAAAVMAPALA
ncbi:sensor domain-containing protein, partial [Streptomyces mirabilis]